MAQTNEQTVQPGPGWVDFAGPARFDEADQVSLAVAPVRFGPATIANIKVHADGGVTDEGTYVEVGVELTLGDARAIIDALQPIVRQAILDGYDGYEGESELPQRPDDWDQFEVAFCGELFDAIPFGSEDGMPHNIVERIDGREEYTDHDRYFWTVYGVHEADDEGHLHDEPCLALVDIEAGRPEARGEALAIALDLAQGRPVYLLGDRMATLVEPIR